MGVVVFMMALGVTFGFLYKQVRSGKPYWIIFNSVMLYPLIVSFFEYQFNLSVYVYYAVILMTIYFYSNSNSKKKESE